MSSQFSCSDGLDATSRRILAAWILLYYAALLPRRGRICVALCLSVCLSVRLSVRPVIVTDRHVAPPGELQWHICTFPHALRAAYRTAISAAQILVNGKTYVSVVEKLASKALFWKITPLLLVSSCYLFSQGGRQLYQNFELNGLVIMLPWPLTFWPINGVMSHPYPGLPCCQISTSYVLPFSI